MENISKMKPTMTPLPSLDLKGFCRDGSLTMVRSTHFAPSILWRARPFSLCPQRPVHRPGSHCQHQSREARTSKPPPSLRKPMWFLSMPTERPKMPARCPQQKCSILSWSGRDDADWVSSVSADHNILLCWLNNARILFCSKIILKSFNMNTVFFPLTKTL